jgi:ligand-binding SRPBCC domain-containing protein
VEIEITRFANEFRLSTELFLSQSIDKIFPYFADARNLEELTPPLLNFKIASTDRISMSVGTIIDYHLRIHRLPIKWKTLISAWEPPYMFVDEQLRGPYRYWIHRHSFEEENGGTIVRDLVRYQIFGGEVVHNLFVKKDLLRIFNHRKEILLGRFG